MKFNLATAIALAGAVKAAPGEERGVTESPAGPATTYTTVITTDYTTYCPYPTTFAFKNVTYTATEATILTVTSKFLTNSSSLLAGANGSSRLPLHCHQDLGARQAYLPASSSPGPPYCRAQPPHARPCPYSGCSH